MPEQPATYSDVQACVDAVLRKVGTDIRLGVPLGLGKANHVVNEFYRRAADDPDIQLHIYTAISLAAPKWSTDLERRYMEPLAERLFGGYPELVYVDPLKQDDLPENIQVTEFYFQPGSFMNAPLAQQNYISSNYSHAVRDLLDAGVNVVAQAIGAEQENGQTRYSLSCNTDLTLDIVPLLRQREREGEKVALIGQVNRNLPFMYGDAIVEAEYFDAVLDAPEYEFPLFGVPNRPVTTSDYMIGLYASALVPDGGTLQIGIGSLGDAVVALLILRDKESGRYRQVLEDAGVYERYQELVDRLGGSDAFEEGLYASSEMLVHGFLELYREGLLRRKVYDHADVQRLLNEGQISEEVTTETLKTLHREGIISSPPSAEEVASLKALGIFTPEVTIDGDQFVLDGEGRVPADLEDEDALTQIKGHCMGDRLQGGRVAHSCFFLGPKSFYEGLRELEPAEREEINMTGISYVNELYGQEELKRQQRKKARFINAGMIATLSGAVASDGLEDGRVVSGVGGQYNFVAMAHALDDGRSILMIPSTRDEGGETTSNIRFNYGHTTIPRHLRDFVITEYGIADLRGKSDEDVVKAMIEVADARFQDELIEQAQNAGKLVEDYELPGHARENTPEALEELLAPFRDDGLFERFPFGTLLTEEEVVLKKALTFLKQTVEGEEISLPGVSDIQKTATVPETAQPYLERLDLADPQNAKETLMQRAVVYSLTSIDAI